MMHTQKKQPSKNTLPIIIRCILYDLSDFNDNDIHIIRDYCNSKNVLFVTRRFNSSKYSDDRYYIKKLPAFHVYIKDSYKETFYLNSDSCKKINEIIELYKDRIQMKEKKKQAWKNFYNNFLNIFRRNQIEKEENKFEMRNGGF